MKTKRFWAKGLLTLASVVTLAACTVKGSDEKIVTMKGDTITVADFYEQVKTTPAAKQAVLTLTLNKVLEGQYGDKVTKEDVAEAYNKMAEQYGASFKTALAQAGMTEEGYKQQIRTEKLLEAAVTTAAEKELTDEAYKKAYETYSPEVTVQVIKLDSEETAKSVLDKVKAGGADFAAIAKENTTGDKEKIEYTFDSSKLELPKDVQTAAFALEKDGISDVITVLDTRNYTSNYYIVKVTQKAEKKDDWKAYEKELKEVIINAKKADPTFINTVVSAALDKANVKIVDNTFADILTQYASTTDAVADAAAKTEEKEADKSEEKTEETAEENQEDKAE